jgi:hypothetical protein
MTMLRGVVAGFESIYLIADALGECPKSAGERDKLLDAFLEMYSWKMDSMHIFVTSKREADIDESFSCLGDSLGFYSRVGVQGKPLRKTSESASGIVWSIATTRSGGQP